MNKREIIAVDIDDVLSSQVDMIIAYSNEKYGTDFTHADFKKPGDYWGYYEGLWGVGKEEGKKRFQEFLDGMYPLQQSILESTKRAITELKSNYDLEVVTSRGSDYRKSTLEWLQKHVPDIFQGVHFVELWNSGGEKATKAKICREIGAGYLIDDNAEHCNLAAEAGVHALLFGEFGWNIGKDLHDRVTRVADWDEVLSYFRKEQQ